MSNNYPPGLNESDIPGSRPEDVEMEKFMDDFFISLPKEESSFVKERIPWLPEAHSVFEKAIQFGIDKGKEEQLRIFAEKRFYQEEYFEDNLTSIVRMLYWRLFSSVNICWVIDSARENEKWEVIAYFGLGGGENRTSGVHRTLSCAIEVLAESIKELTKDDEVQNQEIIKQEEEAKKAAEAVDKEENAK